MIKQKIKAAETDAYYNGFWFSNEPDTSAAWSKGEYTKKVYLNITNPAPREVINKSCKRSKKKVKLILLLQEETNIH